MPVNTGALTTDIEFFAMKPLDDKSEETTFAYINQNTASILKSKQLLSFNHKKYINLLPSHTRYHRAP